MNPQVTLTQKQIAARALAQSKARFILFRGGSRSGKSFLVCFLILMRALVCPKSRHGIFRHTAVDVRRTLFDLTFKNMMEIAYPGLWERLKKIGSINDTEMTIELPNGSMILFDGLDDSTRQDRILGNEFSTIFVNEVSQFKTFDIFQKLIGRLSLELPMESGKLMAPKLFLDCNPTSKRHWTYRAFIDLVNPISGEGWPRPDEWAEIQMNPVDNTENISSTYLADLENQSARDRKRFMDGEWQAENDNALFLPEFWAGDGKHKRLPPRTPGDREGFKRVVVSIDPAGSSKPNADETGIVVVGLDEENHCYVLADNSGRYTPPEWGRTALDAYDLWDADYIVCEDNFGKEMVPNTLRMLSRSVPIKTVTAGSSTGGKSKRALPVATLYEQGLVHHCGCFDKLETQLEDFHLDWNSNKDGYSPDRLDALVWAVTELAVKEDKRGASLSRIGSMWR